MTLRFTNENVSCLVNVMSEKEIVIQGRVANASAFRTMELVAANPIDRRTSYHGSGLPFPCPQFALENTPNRAFAEDDGTFFATFAYPNSYYTIDGTTKIKPSIFFVLTPKDNAPATYIRFELPEDPTLFLRTLTHRVGRTDPQFYAAKDSELDPIPSSAENVMRAFKEFKAARDKAV